MDNLFDSLTPEQLEALLQGSTLQDKGSLLNEQLQQLMAGDPQHVEHSTPMGAALGGLAEALGQGVNAYHVKALRGDQQKNLDAQGKLKGDFGKLLRSPKAPGMSPDELAPYSPSPSMPPMMAAPEEHAPDVSIHAGMPSQSDIAPSWGLSAPKQNQPTDPTAIVDDGSDGWGIDFSHPGYVEALARGRERDAQAAAPPVSTLDGAQASSGPSPLPDMTQLPPRKERKRLPFGY
jgi:hypothetical protein